MEENKNLQEELKNLPPLLELDDTFTFHCTACGKCCIHRNDIILSPEDLFRIAKFLDMSPESIVKTFCHIYIGDNSRIPLVALKPRGNVQRCPFLENRKCSIHPAKPTVCALFPLGRMIMTDGTKENRDVQIRYFCQDTACGDYSQAHKVGEWLKESGIPADDPFYYIWQGKAVFVLTRLFKKAEKSCSPIVLEKMWNVIILVLYYHYDIQKEFFPQFEKNWETAEKMLRMLYPKYGRKKK